MYEKYDYVYIKPYAQKFMDIHIYIYIYIYIYYRYINSYIQHYENAYEVIKCEKITNSCLNMNTCIDNTYIVAEIMHICTGQ